MFKVEQFRRPLGVGAVDQVTSRVRTVAEGIRDLGEAERIVQAQLQGAASAGRNAERDYWWCRQEGASHTDIYAIRREQDFSPISG